jgi:hypothetical protein
LGQERCPLEVQFLSREHDEDEEDDDDLPGGWGHGEEEEEEEDGGAGEPFFIPREAEYLYE